MSKKQMIYEVNIARGWKSPTARKFYAYAMSHTEEETREEYKRIAQATNYGIKGLWQSVLLDNKPDII